MSYNPPVIEPSKQRREKLSLTDWITAISTLVIMFWAGLQWHEMHTGGADTAAIAIAAGKQADTSKTLAEQAQTQTTNMTKSLEKTDALIRTASDQVEELKAGVATQRQQLELTDRPWIRVEIEGLKDLPENNLISGGIRLNEGIGQLGRSITLHNAGKSVATDVRIREATIAMAIEDTNVWFPVDVQKDLCKNDSDVNGTDGRRRPVFAVFPGIPRTTYEGGSFDIKKIPDRPEYLALKMGKPYALYLIGCVDYRYDLSAHRHQTGFIFEIFAGPNHEGLQVNKPVSAAQISFVPFYLGGDYAY
jgi:hypothetical protein